VVRPNFHVGLGITSDRSSDMLVEAAEEDEKL
jgi:hypothetical protein